jgi:hypothetical protein
VAEKLPYDRQAGIGWAALTFGPPRVLDATRLRRLWTSWFELSHHPEGPICATSAAHLVDQLADPATEPAAPYCALILAADARSRVVRQSRSDEFLGRTPREVADRTGQPRWHLLAEQVERGADQPVARRTVLVTLLTQLGFYDLAIEVAGTTTLTTAADQHLSYETARAWRQAARSTPTATSMLLELATTGTHAPTSILACTQLVSIVLRDRRENSADQDWIELGEARLPALDSESPWVRALVVSRFWRAVAFQRLRDGDKPGSASALDLAYAADDECQAAATNPIESHCARENRRLLYDVTVKAGTAISTSERLDRAVAGLLELDGREASARFHVAALAARDGDPVAAAEEFDRAAQGGTIRGAAAAARAAQSWTTAGNTDRAARSWELLIDLDPAAVIPADVPVGGR